MCFTSRLRIDPYFPVSSCALVKHRRGHGEAHHAAELLKFHTSRVDPEDAAQRIAERDVRLEADTRTDIQRLLGEPPPGRSALAQAAPRRGT